LHVRLGPFGRLTRRVPRAAAAIILAGTLGACSSAGGGGPALIQSATSATGAPTAGTKVVKQVYNPSDFAADGYCPPLQLRPGTESLPIYEKGHDGEQDYVRFQAAIYKTARQCSTSGDTLTMKIGIDGRVVAGPKGGAGTLSMPLRIAVVKQSGGKGPLYSRLFKIPVSVSGPTFGADFSQVIENVSFKISPADHDLIVYVGFDDGKKSPPPSG